jgi:hypothetical protein
MSLRDLPVLVARLTSAQASALGCARCGFERQATEDEIGAADPGWSCEIDGCDGRLEWVYMEADACANCGKLGYWPEGLKGCCSRVCQLQREYAKELEARRGSA